MLGPVVFTDTQELDIILVFTTTYGNLERLYFLDTFCIAAVEFNDAEHFLYWNTARIHEQVRNLRRLKITYHQADKS